MSEAVPEFVLREAVRPSDVAAVRDLVRRTGYFNDDEVRIAAELVEARLAKGPASGYEFLFADRGDALLGYSCWGHVDGTRDSYDLYWIAVSDELRGQGIGRNLLHETEARIAARGGGRIWVETSGRAQYAPTRAFYERCGYQLEAELRDFYGPGDSKRIYARSIADAR